MGISSDLKRRGMKQKKVLLIILIIIFFICVGSVLWCVSIDKKNSKTPLLYERSAVIYEPKDQNLGVLNKDQIILPGLKEVTVHQGVTNVSLPLFNNKFNDVDLVFEVILKEQNKILRTTNRVAPGKAVLITPLPSNLEKGQYHLEIRIKVYRQGGNEELNNGTITTKLVVQ